MVMLEMLSQLRMCFNMVIKKEKAHASCPRALYLNATRCHHEGHGHSAIRPKLRPPSVPKATTVHRPPTQSLV